MPAAGHTTSMLAAASRLDALLAAIQPSPSSEFRRLTIAHYICGVIKRCFLPFQVRRLGKGMSAVGAGGASAASQPAGAPGMPVRCLCASWPPHRRLVGARLSPFPV